MQLQLPLNYQFRSKQSNTGKDFLLVLMHGVGSNEADMMGLALYVPPAFNVLSLRAPHVLGPQAFAWFQFGVQPNGERIIDTAQELASRALVAQTVQAAASQLGIAPERVVVGGFSQGGIMALSLLLTKPAFLQGVLVMHSRLLPEVLTDAVPAAHLQGKQVWISHGLQDNVIPLASAHAAKAHMQTLPVQLHYAEFPGAHEIRPAELQAAMQWLAEFAA